MAFASALLDVVGSAPDLEAIMTIEHYGRLVSGLALTLLAWSWLVLPAVRRYGLNLVATGILLSASCGVSIALAFQMQERIVHTIVERANPEERQAALLLSMAARSVVAGDLELAGITLDAATLATPEGKAFVALLPALALDVPDLVERSHVALDVMAARAVIGALPPAEVMFSDYEREVAQIRVDFEILGPLIAAFEDRATSPEVDEEVEALWRDYVSAATRRGWTVGAIPHEEWPAVRQQFRDRGFEVPDDWSPNDGRRFRDLTRQGIVAQDIEAFVDEAQRLTGHPAPPISDFGIFFAHAATQARLYQNVRVYDPSGIPPGLDLDAFIAGPYAATARVGVDRHLEAVRARAASFGPGGEHAILGAVAAKTAWIPVVALLFSAAGALTHAVKSIGLIMKVISWRVPVPTRMKRVVLVASAAALGFTPFAPNAITSSELYQALPGSSLSMEWMIGAQALIHPFGSLLRSLLTV
jgi:hypothetical protein